MISTDTIMAPFLAAGLLFYWRLLDRGRATDGLISGAMIGAAFLAKYAGVYFFIGAALAAIIVPGRRPSLAQRGGSAGRLRAGDLSEHPVEPRAMI